MITKQELKSLAGSADELNNSVLTVYLNVDPGKVSNANRGFESTLHRLLMASHPPVHGVAEAQRFIEAADYIQKFVSSFEPQRRTLCLVYDQADRFFWVRELNVRLQDSAHWGMRPYLKPLTEAIGEFDQYAVALIGETRARLFRVVLGEIEEYLKPAGHTVPSIERMILNKKIDRLIVAGPRANTARLRRAMPKRLKRITIGSIELPFEATPDAVLNAIAPLVETFENEQETQLVDDLISTAGDRLAVTGLGRTLQVLNDGSVANLVYTEGLQSSGYECPCCAALFSRDRERCTYCGSPLIVVDNLSERMLARAAASGARIHVLPSRNAAGLADSGGVGAFLKAAPASRQARS